MRNQENAAGGCARRYAILAGRVDEAITYLEDMARRQDFDWFHVLRVTGLLKSALLEAEEQYIAAGEEAELRQNTQTRLQIFGGPSGGDPGCSHCNPPGNPV